MEETLLLLILMIASDFNVKKKCKKRTKRFWMRKRLAVRHKKVLTITSSLNFKTVIESTIEIYYE